jgi:hypothetical protein
MYLIQTSEVGILVGLFTKPRVKFFRAAGIDRIRVAGIISQKGYQDDQVNLPTLITT